MRNNTLIINSQNKGVDISPTFMGLFFEDINYAGDGGLYAELINNRSFEFGRFKDTFSKHDDYFYAWSVVSGEGAELVHTQENEGAIHENNPHYLRVQINQVGEGIGISNEGFGGIAVSKNSRYDFSIYLRKHDYLGNVEVSIESKEGCSYASATIKQEELVGEWAKYQITLTYNETDDYARLTLSFDGEGSLDIDMVSLFPEETWNNRKNGLRKDLVGMLKDINPKFLRFPGGCIVEGKQLINAYNWKDTVGPIEHRKTNWNRWEEWVDYPYNQSYGLGFYEYFLLCEDIGATPLPILNCGMSCQFQDAEIAENLEPFIQDALDLIEYANGDITTEWGAKRAEHGHPEPFNLIYLGIGNEQWVDAEKPYGSQYFEHYDAFQKRIKEKYPEIKLVTSSGPYPEGKEYEEGWEIIDQKAKEHIAQGTVYAELVDEHFYRPQKWFLENTKRYDNFPRYEDGQSCKVFAGEYACHIDGEEMTNTDNNLHAALCEAAMLTGMERNSDVVAMTSYAPLFAKATSMQWKPDLIWFDNTKAYASPSYYVQKMFGNNMGTYTLKTEEDFLVFHIVSKDETTGDIIIKLVNVEDEVHEVNINIENETTINPVAHGCILAHPDKAIVNSLENPVQVEEKQITIEGVAERFSYVLPANSFVVIRVHTR